MDKVSDDLLFVHLFASSYARARTGETALRGIMVPDWDDFEIELEERIVEALVRDGWTSDHDAAEYAHEVYEHMVDEWLGDHIAVYRERGEA